MTTEETKYLATVTAPEFGVKPRVVERGGGASVTWTRRPEAYIEVWAEPRFEEAL